MADAQVSNARRAVFTALALIVFWVTAWEAYEDGTGCYFAFPEGMAGTTPSWPEQGWESLLEVWTFRILAFASTPVIFLLVANENSPVRACRDRFVLGASALVLGSVAVSSWIGSVDAEVAIEAWQARPNDDPTIEAWLKERRNMNYPWSSLPMTGRRSIVSVSWTLLLLPLILASAFIIHGARRRAARDAAIEAAGEDE